MMRQVFVEYDPDCGTLRKRRNDLGGDVLCTASHAGHPCLLDRDSLDHWDHIWDEETEGHWLLGITHRCGCNEPVTWPEVY